VENAVELEKIIVLDEKLKKVEFAVNENEECVCAACVFIRSLFDE